MRKLGQYLILGVIAAAALGCGSGAADSVELKQPNEEIQQQKQADPAAGGANPPLPEPVNK